MVSVVLPFGRRPAALRAAMAAPTFGKTTNAEHWFPIAVVLQKFDANAEKVVAYVNFV